MILGDLPQAPPGAPRVATHPRERLVHPHPQPLGDDALGLLDDDSAVERLLQLVGNRLQVEGGPILKEGDGGDVGEGLGGAKAGSDRHRCKARPAVPILGQVDGAHHDAAVKAVTARALAALHLEELDRLQRVIGGGDQAQVPLTSARSSPAAAASSRGAI